MNNNQAIDRLVKHLEWGWSEETAEAIKMGIHALKETKWNDILMCHDNPVDLVKAVFGEFNVIEVESEEVIDSVIGWHYETIPTDALSKCEPFCYSMPLTEDYVKSCKMKVIGNIWDKSEDAKPKETDNIIYHDFMKKGRE
jgi:hypothetical protein